MKRYETRSVQEGDRVRRMAVCAALIILGVAGAIFFGNTLLRVLCALVAAAALVFCLLRCLKERSAGQSDAEAPRPAAPPAPPVEKRPAAPASPPAPAVKERPPETPPVPPVENKPAAPAPVPAMEETQPSAPAPVPAEAQPGEEAAEPGTVFVTEKGGRYHRDVRCMGLLYADYVRRTTVAEAVAQGRTPCGWCHKAERQG